MHLKSRQGSSGRGGVPSADALLFKTRVQMCLFRNNEEAYSAGYLDNNRVDEQIHPCCHVIDYASDITAPNKPLLGALLWMNTWDWIFIVQKLDVEFKRLRRRDIGSLDFTITTTEVYRVSAVSKIFSPTTSDPRDACCRR